MKKNQLLFCNIHQGEGNSPRHSSNVTPSKQIVFPEDVHQTSYSIDKDFQTKLQAQVKIPGLLRNKPSVLQKVTLKVTSKYSDNIRDFVCVVFYQAMANNQMILMARPQMSTHLGDNFRVSSSRSR